MSSSSFIKKLHSIVSSYEDVSTALSNPDISRSDFVYYSKKSSDLGEVSQLASSYISIHSEIDDLQLVLLETTENEMKTMINDELHTLSKTLEELEDNLKIALLPDAKTDRKNAILEIRAGTGGEEAALFASVLFKIYYTYANKMGWKFTLLDKDESDIGGIKECVISISGENVFEKLKFESGVHRVQRIPETESSGRIHTSAATVAVMPEAEEVDVEISMEDIRVDVYRAGGAGGQHVNKTESAVRLTHIPSGIVVICQDDRSQKRNKESAMKVLRSKIFDIQIAKQKKEESDLRRSKVGSGDRSERIRTYNFPQNRITDHRYNISVFKMSEVINEGGIHHMIDAILKEDRIQVLNFIQQNEE